MLVTERRNLWTNPNGIRPATRTIVVHHAAATCNKSDFTYQQREIVKQFIDELLDTRLEIQNAEHQH